MDLTSPIPVAIPATNGTIAPLGKWIITPQIADGAPPGPPEGTIMLSIAAGTSAGVKRVDVRADDAALNAALTAIAPTMGLGAQQALTAILLALKRVAQPAIEAAMRAPAP
jgi:hypothetical protein